MVRIQIDLTKDWETLKSNVNNDDGFLEFMLKSENVEITLQGTEENLGSVAGKLLTKVGEGGNS